ncbi:MAG: phosphoglycerate kinase [Fusobacteria bacterium]|nr:phosphoglycerate kinase [Fusobacteriota bacterium]
MAKKTVRDIEITGKRILMRVDFNVPMKDGVIQDDRRMRAAIPTIEYILEKKAKSLVVMSHLGDPAKDTKKAVEKAEKEGKAFDAVKFSDGKHKMAPIAKHLSELLGKPVKLAPAAFGPEVDKMVSELKDGEVLLLENTRYHKEETSKDDVQRMKMAKELAKYGDIFVNDAFGTAHRAHASTVDIAKLLPAVSGFLMEKEIKFIGGVVENPEKPYVAILGGAKVSDKIKVIENLMDKADKILIGGAMMFTFFKAQGKNVGKSLFEEDSLDVAKTLLAKAAAKNVALLLPIDAVVAQEFSNDVPCKVVSVDAIEEGWMGLDVGPATVKLFSDALIGSKTVVWNGPMGVFELSNFAKGTIGVCEAIAKLQGAITVIGGGDSASAAEKLGFAKDFSHVSTGGGASLEYLEGKVLPGVAALLDK